MLSFDMFGAILQSRYLEDREIKLMTGLACHISENDGGESRCKVGYDQLRISSGIRSNSTLKASIDLAMAMGLIRTVPGKGKATTTFYVNDSYLEAMRRDFLDLRKSLKEAAKPKGAPRWTKAYEDELARERDALYTDGVPLDLVPSDWFAHGAGPNRFRIAELQERPEPSATVAVKRKRPSATATVALNCGKQDPSATVGDRSATVESRSATPMGVDKQITEEQKARAPRERRQAEGTGARDGELRTLGLQEMIAFWAGGSAWEAIEGMTLPPGPPPDDPSAVEKVDLKPFSLGWVLDRVVLPAAEGRPTQCEGRFIAAAAQIHQLRRDDPDELARRVRQLTELLAGLKAHRSTGRVA